MLQIIFWILIGIVFYSYFGYTLLLMAFTLFKKKKLKADLTDSELPEVTLLIAAYNEKDIIPSKIENSDQLIYPKEKLYHLWITDGSNDGSVEYLKSISGIEVMHLPERKGKTAAINRAMKMVKTPITILCDANSMLSPMAVKELVTSFHNDSVGCVAGEKRIVALSKDKATGAGEGFYWNYESIIKKLEAGFGSTLGAAGELYAIRTDLYEAPAENIILDDFVVSLKIAEKGYFINYQPEAFASESSSFSIEDEMKRKIRIAAGSFQVLFGMPSLMNFFMHFRLSFQYFSHKVLRWLIVPFALPALFLINLLLATSPNIQSIYVVTLALQIIFYLMVFMGSLLNEKVTRFKLLFYPFYIAMMNYCIVLGLVRHINKDQNAAWEKVRRN